MKEKTGCSLVMIDLTGQMLGQYELIEVLGKGGVAMVYRGRQLNIDRLVAVKVLSAHLSAQEQFRSRFEREARVIARLEHDRIVPIYDFGDEQGHFFLVMRLLDNGLNRLIQRGPLSVELTNYFVQEICQGLQYAHEKNVIHRDIKPSNILLSRDGHTFLSDFGLARLAGGTSITEQGSMLGTPAYMAPEMWEDGEVSVLTDLYALGVTIYEMLRGAPPFQRPTPASMMYDHLEKPPPPLVGSVPGVSIEVQAIVDKLLRKRPEERFYSAREVAEAFHKASRNDVDQAKVSTRQSKRLAEGADRRNGARTLVFPAVGDMDDLRPTYMVSAPHTWRQWAVFSSVIGLVVVIAAAILVLGIGNNDLVQGPTRVASANIVNEEPVTLPERELAGANEALHSVAWSPDGGTIAGVDKAGNLILWKPSGSEAEDGGVVVSRAWFAHDGGAVDLAWNPADPQMLASIGRDNLVQIWDVREDGKLLRTLGGDTVDLEAVAWSPDGAQVVVGGGDGRISRWVISNDWERAQTRITQPVQALDWSPDGLEFVSGGADHGVRVWSPEGAANTVVGNHLGEIVALDWGAEGALIAALSDNGNVRLWDLEAEQSASLYRNLAVPVAIRFSPDSSRVAAAGAGQVRVWDVATGVLVGVLSPARDIRLNSIEWQPNGTELAGATDTGVLLLWTVPDVAPVRLVDDRSVSGHGGRVNRLRWEPGGERVASVGADGVLRIWNGRTGRRMAEFKDSHSGEVTAAAWSPDASQIATGGCDGTIVIWDVAGEQSLEQLIGNQGCVTDVAFSADGQYVVSIDTVGTLRRWRLGSYALVNRQSELHNAGSSLLSQTNDEEIIASAGAGGLLRVWRFVGDGFELLATRQASTSPFTSIDWNAGSGSAASGSEDGLIRFWDAPLRSNMNYEFGWHLAPVTALGRDAASEFLASADANGCLALWSLETQEKLFHYCEPTPTAYRTLEWSPAADTFVVGTEGGEIIFWRLP